MRVDQGRNAEALALLDEALRIKQSRLDASSREVVELRFMLGERMWALGGDRDRARTLVDSAHDPCQANPRLDPPMCEAIAAWVDAH